MPFLIREEQRVFKTLFQPRSKVDVTADPVAEVDVSAKQSAPLLSLEMGVPG